MFNIMFKQIFITLICFSFLFLATACQAEKEVVIPPHAYVSVEESPETFKKNNEDIKQYWSFDDNPLNIGSLGVTFYKLRFPSDNYATVTFTYPSVPPLTIENVSSTSGFYSHDRPEQRTQHPIQTHVL